MPIMMAMLLAAAKMPGAEPFDLAGRTVVLATYAEGAQVYECKAAAAAPAAWVFREPIATLISAGKTIGRHYAGPHWELDDGSLVQGKPAGSTPGATAADIPSLKLDIVANKGDGVLAAATEVYRIAAKGGALAGACDVAGALKAVPYEADYIFTK